MVVGRGAGGGEVTTATGLGARLSALGLASLLAAGAGPGAVPFVLDGNRVYARVEFVRPDGSTRAVLAFVDLGGTEMELTSELYAELGLDERDSLRVRVGGVEIVSPKSLVSAERRRARSLPGATEKVEATLPAIVLLDHRLTIDYARRTLEVRPSGAVGPPPGLATPMHLDARTGLVAVDAVIDGRAYGVTIDPGSAYTWLNADAAQPWMRAHPEWVRGTGAVGPANMRMSGDSAESDGRLLRILEVRVGTLSLPNVGALAVADPKLFEWYARKNAVPVIGWIGGNVLRRFRITIDYPTRMMYWERTTPPDTAELDQVGIVLRAEQGRITIAAIATKKGVPTVAEVQPGDALLRIGDLDVATASWGEIWRALHGPPGAHRQLVLERMGRPVSVTAKVTAF